MITHQAQGVLEASIEHRHVPAAIPLAAARGSERWTLVQLKHLFGGESELHAGREGDEHAENLPEGEGSL